MRTSVFEPFTVNVELFPPWTVLTAVSMVSLLPLVWKSLVILVNAPIEPNPADKEDCPIALLPPPSEP